uniref:C-type lectin domain-containing protein n=1 Tax=Scophthalmus maximus TaxID=52904 RepID=A0A8D3CMS3_SCOMX
MKKYYRSQTFCKSTHQSSTLLVALYQRHKGFSISFIVYVLFCPLTIISDLTTISIQSFCRVKYTDLATVNNMDDGRRLVDALGSRVTHTWIGLRRAGGDRWMWSDGKNSTIIKGITDGKMRKPCFPLPFSLASNFKANSMSS